MRAVAQEAERREGTSSLGLGLYMPARSRCRMLDQDALDLVERDLVVAPIVEAGGAG